MNENKSPQNRYCCVPLCNQKGTTGPNGEKVGFFSIPTDTSLRAQWLHAIRRDTGKHFTITDSTKVCSLHFKNEHLEKSLGIGRLSCVDGAVPSVFEWKRSSPQKRPLPTPTGNSALIQNKKQNKRKAGSARSSLDMSVVAGPSSESLSIDATESLNEFSLESNSEAESCETVTTDNQLSYDDLRKKLAKMEQLLEESRTKNAKLEAEVEKVRTHAFKISEKCANLEKRIFTVDNFTSDEDITFYTGFPSYDVFMATYNYLNPGRNGENIRFWRSVSNDVDPEYYEREPELGVGPGRPRTLNAKEEFFLVMCRLRQGFPECHLGHVFKVWAVEHMAIPKSGE